MTPQVYVSGLPVSTLAPVSDLVLACEWPDGSGTGVGGFVGATFGLLLPIAKRPGWLVKNAFAEVRMGGLCLGAGFVSEVDWEGGTVSINGAATEGSTTLCLDGSGGLSSTPDTILDAAISRAAVTWNRPASISTTALTTGDTTASLNYVTDMLSQFGRVNTGARIYVDQARSVRSGVDPTQAEFVIEAGAGELPWASDSQATRLAGRWADATGTLTTTFVGSGPIERAIDMVTPVGDNPAGVYTSTTATALLNSLLTQMTVGGWGGGLTLSPNHFLGTPHLAQVFLAASRGLMVRNLGQRDPRPDRLPTMGVDFIVERAEWHVADNVIVLTPRGMVSRDFASILSDAGVQEAA